MLLIKRDLQEFQSIEEKPDDRLLDYAISLTFEQFKLPEKVKMIHLNDVFQEDLNIWNDSPGLPWTTDGYKTKNDIREDPDAIQSVRRFWHYVKSGIDFHPPDCLAYARSHDCEKGEAKVQAVWDYPATVTFGEAMFAVPLLDAYTKLSKCKAYGYEMFNGDFNKLYQRFNREGHFVGLVFSNFIKTLPAWIVRQAFKILMANIDFAAYRDYGVPNASRNLHMYLYIVDYCINTPIRTANGLRYRKSNGIASGSYFAQLVGSVANAILVNWISLKLTRRPPDDAVFLGDYSLFMINKRVGWDEISKIIGLIGMKINENKCEQSQYVEDIKFLG